MQWTLTCVCAKIHVLFSVTFIMNPNQLWAPTLRTTTHLVCNETNLNVSKELLSTGGPDPLLESMHIGMNSFDTFSVMGPIIIATSERDEIYRPIAPLEAVCCLS